MVLRGHFLRNFEVQFASLAASRTTKQSSLIVSGLNSREAFPSQYYKLKNLEVHRNNEQIIQHRAQNENPQMPDADFKTSRPQLTEEECVGVNMRNCGNYIVREAILDEEYWIAAWFRAEAHYETSPMSENDNLNLKMKYADKEFYAMKRRCSGQEGNSLNCFCLVAVMKELENRKITAMRSILGTLDLSIRQFFPGETYPEGTRKHSSVLASQEPFDAHKYAYISNVVVKKGSRRLGIASNMLYFATDIATTKGMKQLFVHVDVANRPAQELYVKTGFKVVDVALSKGQNLLMAMDL